MRILRDFLESKSVLDSIFNASFCFSKNLLPLVASGLPLAPLTRLLTAFSSKFIESLSVSASGTPHTELIVCDFCVAKWRNRVALPRTLLLFGKASHKFF